MRKRILINKKILIISPESWGDNFVSKHHYALQLSKIGNRIYFLNPPSESNYLKSVNENLFVVSNKSRFKGIRYLPAYVSGLIIRKEIDRLEKMLSIKFDIIWNFDTSRFFNLSHVNNKLKIAQFVDWNDKINRSLLSKTTDINFCTSEFLKEELITTNKHVYNIGHGYSLSGYKLDKTERKIPGSKYPIKAGYVGNLSIRYIDWEAFHSLIISFPEIGFYFIGPEGNSNLAGSVVQNEYYIRIKELKNVIFLGQISSWKIPAYLKLFDILLILYKSEGYTKQLANPHKTLEYLGSGNVVVSSFIDEYKRTRGLIEMADNKNDFQARFHKVVQNLEIYNSEERKMIRIQHAIKNSYTEKINKIESILNSISVDSGALTL